MLTIRSSAYWILWTAVSVFHFLVYFGSQYLEGEPRTVGWRIDERIPFLPGFVYVYCSWFVLLLALPLLLNAFAPAVCLRYLIANALDLTVSVSCFLLRPTTFQRPEPKGRGLTLFAIRTVYRSNHRFLNCAPSVHCSLALLFVFSLLAAPAVPLALRLGLSAHSLLIVVSTVLVKQHVLLDVVTAIPTAALCWLLSGLFDTARWAAQLL